MTEADSNKKTPASKQKKTPIHAVSVAQPGIGDRPSARNRSEIDNETALENRYRFMWR
jgi:hypothetical protein